jgi:hypothetical protein
MKFRNLVLAIAGLLASTGAAQAQQFCSTSMAGGQYGVSLTGSATLAVTPLLVTAPVVALGVVRIDDAGAISGIGSLATVVAGTYSPETLTASRLTVNSDCTLVFKVTCANGCSWEGSGFLLPHVREMHLVITKAVGYPLTAAMTLKRISN